MAEAAQSNSDSRFAVVGGDVGAVPTGTATSVRAAIATMIKGLARR